MEKHVHGKAQDGVGKRIALVMVEEQPTVEAGSLEFGLYGVELQHMNFGLCVGLFQKGSVVTVFRKS